MVYSAIDISSCRAQLDSCPTALHVSEYLARRLAANGFVEVVSPVESERDNPRNFSASNGFLRQGGAILAWSAPPQSLRRGIRIVGAHSDSPGLRIHPNPDILTFNWRQLGVEIYGGPLLNSWLDRDLGIAGHVVLRGGETKLFTSRLPLARISQLAIHLDRDVNERGLTLDKHQHLTPVWATSPGDSFGSWVSQQCGFGADGLSVGEIVAVDARLFDFNPSAIIGVDDSMLASARLDNQVSCWAAIEALVAISRGPIADHASFAVLFDHEEVGSQSATGAAGPLLEHTLEQMAIAHGLDRSQFLDCLSHSHCVSADNAHAVHPNYPQRHDDRHSPRLNGGPVVKSNANQRYATSATSIAPFLSACGAANVPTQEFVSRNDIPCGSTIGPITATRLGIDTIDVGVPQLSMHSIREVCGVQDLPMMAAALTVYFNRL